MKGKGVVLAGVMGNILEWYDFTIYAFFVPVIAKQFFPSQDAFVALLATFGVFAVGFLVRPVGALLFGYVGDHMGRKNALVLSMIMISLPTFFIGLLPTHQQIGMLAPLLLVSLRIIQGLAVSGELTTATVFLIEHAEEHKRGRAGSFAMSGALLGIVTSSFLASVTSMLLTDVQLSSWGWRLPFLLGGVIGIKGILIRLRTVEPSVYLNSHQTAKVSMWQHIKTLSPYSLLIGVLLTSIMATCNYFILAYFNTFLTVTQKLPLRPVMMINTFALTLQTLLTVVMGSLSDYVGRKRVLGGGIIALIIGIYPIFFLLSQPDLMKVMLGACLFAIAASPLTGAIPTTLAEMFDTYHRNTGISLSYNLSLAIFGGTAPLIAITLVAWTHSVYAPAWYLMGGSILAFLALLQIRETYQKKFVILHDAEHGEGTLANGLR